MRIYNDYSTMLKEKYGEKIYKLPVNLPVSCPNRDGTRGCGGCRFCGEVGAGFESLDTATPVKEQLQINREYMGSRYKAKKFIAYLQNYTNTYLPPEDFERVINDCAADDIVELSVSTRPDCVPEAYLKTADKFHEKYGIDVTFELGLQTANTKTLRMIGRGHTLAEYIGAALRIKAHGFGLCTHLIPNLPTDEIGDVKEAAQLVSVLKNDAVKLHNLFLMQGTPMAEQYLNGEFEICRYEEYFERVAVFLEYLSPNVSVERFFARCPEEGCVFSNWGRSWRWLQNELMTYLFQRGTVQGMKCGEYEDGIVFSKTSE